MRDSLSILDKIVSFTNGTVTYQNTLEHLNILDEDYYFRMLDSMQQQDMAAAMLLFDEINRKGFEGDMVLNGFAEFLRNLLVCRDPKSAALLEVVEGMQDKFMATAARTGMSYLVSALNILNEAEINYKMARNKRLHVELVLIKLNFLQQAIDLSVENGAVVKKKRLDAPVAFRTKQVPPLQFNTPAPAAKLYMEKTPTPTAAVKPIQTAPLQNPKPQTPNPKPPPTNGTGNKKNLLDTLRDKYGDKYEIEEVTEAEVLSMERLRKCWDTYAVQLEQQLKHSSAGTFKSARLVIENEIRFTVTVAALTSQKFVEQERMMLMDHLYKEFNNRAIVFEVLVEAGEKEDIPAHMRLNSKQKFEHIAQQYPLVKELKDRLKLEIDY
jgi:DNA polymerase-3 subunit gamma/tau